MVKMACAHASQYHEFPDKYLISIENALSQKMGNQFVTAVYSVIDTKEMTVTTSNAGHYAMILCKASGSIMKIKPKGFAIGIYQNAFFDVAQEKIEKGDRIVLFTDGVIELRNRNGELFGEERFYRYYKRIQWKKYYSSKKCNIRFSLQVD